MKCLVVLTNDIGQLELTVGYNHSDSTFGWKGYKQSVPKEDTIYSPKVLQTCPKVT